MFWIGKLHVVIPNNIQNSDYYMDQTLFLLILSCPSGLKPILGNTDPKGEADEAVFFHVFGWILV